MAKIGMPNQRLVRIASILSWKFSSFVNTYGINQEYLQRNECKKDPERYAPDP